MEKQIINEKPILFSSKMVNAILENKKIVTRRVVEPQPPYYIDFFIYFKKLNYFGVYTKNAEPISYPSINSKYAPENQLWIKEAWGIIGYEIGFYNYISAIYRADKSSKLNIEIDNEELWNRFMKREDKQNFHQKPILWRSSLFMPRIVSRINLKIIDVKIERLQKLDDNEAQLEGCKDKEDFINIWDSINSKNNYTWIKNPWVYRIQFEKI